MKLAQYLDNSGQETVSWNFLCTHRVALHFHLNLGSGNRGPRSKSVFVWKQAAHGRALTPSPSPPQDRPPSPGPSAGTTLRQTVKFRAFWSSPATIFLFLPSLGCLQGAGTLVCTFGLSGSKSAHLGPGANPRRHPRRHGRT